VRAGNVPTARVAPVLERLILERWPNGGGIDVLAEKVDCDASTIEGIVAQEYPGVAFDLADSLLCALGPGIRAWRGELEDVYYGVEFVSTCALPSCGKTFAETGRGGRRLYCSRKCRNLNAMVRDGRATGERLRAKKRCLKGHRLTPDNVVQGNRCRACRRERDRAYAQRYRAENPEKHRAAVRRYQQKQKLKAAA
jgi:hypothetical protein